MRIKALLLLPALLAALPSLARDFEYTYEDHTIIYTILDEDAKTVMTKEGLWNSPGNNVSGELIIPEKAKDGNVEFTVIKIGDYAFRDCSYLTEVIIPNSVTEIGRQAFYKCERLTSLTIGKSLQTIDIDAFKNCDHLKKLYYNAENMTKPEVTYYTNLFPASVETLVIGDGVKRIPERIFSGLDKITSVTIPNSVNKIGCSAFNSCSSLISLTIPESVTEIGEAAFSECSALSSMEIPNSVTKIDANAFYNCSSLTSLIIPTSVTELGGWVFSGCSGLASVSIPTSITAIPRFAFESCSGLTEVSIPESITMIESGAFGNCTALSSLTIPASVSEIEGSAFYECTGLTSIKVNRSVPPVLGEDAFYHVTNTIPVYVPAGSVDMYRNAYRWNYFFDFREISGGVVELAVALSETALELKEGETATLITTISKPEDVTVTAEEWTSSDEAVATVDGGTVTAVTEGKATITYTATFGNGETRTATCEVTVIKQSGIEAISAEAEDDAEFFTLQGIRVKTDKLAPGVYICRRGNRTDKVLVK